MIFEEFNLDILTTTLNDKKARGILVDDYLKRKSDFSRLLIKRLNLKRINNKYILKTRFYDKNSYSKKKIKEEEMIFCQAVIRVLPIESFFKEQLKIYESFNFNNSVFNDLKKDEEIYFKLIKLDLKDFNVNNITSTIIKKQDIYKDYNFDIYSIILESNNFRKKILKTLKDEQLMIFLIRKYDLILMKDIYINNLELKFNSSYQRNKIKKEEIFLIKKIYQIAIFISRVQKYEIQYEDLIYRDMNSILKRHDIKTSYIYEYYTYNFFLELDNKK